MLSFLIIFLLTQGFIVSNLLTWCPTQRGGLGLTPGVVGAPRWSSAGGTRLPPAPTAVWVSAAPTSNSLLPFRSRVPCLKSHMPWIYSEFTDLPSLSFPQMSFCSCNKHHVSDSVPLLHFPPWPIVCASSLSLALTLLRHLVQKPVPCSHLPMCFFASSGHPAQHREGNRLDRSVFIPFHISGISFHPTLQGPRSCALHWNQRYLRAETVLPSWFCLACTMHSINIDWENWCPFPKKRDFEDVCSVFLLMNLLQSLCITLWSSVSLLGRADGMAWLHSLVPPF